MKYSEWKNVKLSDIADITMGQSPKSEFYNNEGIGIEFLQGNRTFGRIYPDYDTWCTKPSRIAEEGSVLMSVRAPVGDLNIANKRVCIGRGLCSLKTKKNNKNIKTTFIKHYDSNYYGLAEWSDEIHKNYFLDAIEEYTVNNPNEKKSKDILKLFKDLDIEDKQDYIEVIEEKIRKAFK